MILLVPRGSLESIIDPFFSSFNFFDGKRICRRQAAQDNGGNSSISVRGPKKMPTLPRLVRSRAFRGFAGLTVFGLVCLEIFFGYFSDGSIPKGAVEHDGRSVEREMRMRRASQVGASLLRYKEATGRFPPPVVYGPDGRPLYSWRVVVALFLEGGNELAREFFWDQPWDSPANQFALARIPVEFAPARLGESGYDGSGMTGDRSYFTRALPVGSTYFDMVAATTPEAGPLLRGLPGPEIPRRLPGTEPGKVSAAGLLLVRDGFEAVPWTKPTVVPAERAQSYHPGTGIGPDGFAAAFADGTVTFVPPGLDEKLIRDLATSHNGGASRKELAQAIGQSGKKVLYDAKPAAYWASELTSGDEKTFAKARNLLMETDPRDTAAVPGLLKALEHPDYVVRLAAAAALVRIGRDTARAVPALVAIANAGEDAAPTARRHHDGPGLLYHQEYASREWALSGTKLLQCIALRLIADIGPAAVAAVPDLRGPLWSDDWRVSDGAAEALSRIGQPAVPLLVEALQDKSIRARERIWLEDPGVSGDMRYFHRLTIPGALACIGPAAVPALLPLLEDAEPDTRLAALDALGRMGLAAASAETEVVACLKDEKIARNAVDALSRIGVGARAAVPVLRKSLKAKPASVTRPRAPGTRNDRDRWETWAEVTDWRTAAEAAGRFGPEAADAVPELVEVLEGNDDELAASAANALCRVGPAAWPAVPILRRKRYVDALCRLGAFDAVRDPGQHEEYYRKYLRDEGSKQIALGLRPLVDALRGSDPALQAVSLEALRQVGPAASPAVPALRELEGDPMHAEKVREVLRAIEGPR
jgi:HEAT repeat protein